MNTAKFRGCGTALITPFRNGAVDYDAYAALVDRQVAGGVDFLVPLGTTGETPCLEDEERNKYVHKISPDVNLQINWLNKYFQTHVKQS